MGDYNDAMMRNQNAAVQARTKAQSRANVLQLKLVGPLLNPLSLPPCVALALLRFPVRCVVLGFLFAVFDCSGVAFSCDVDCGDSLLIWSFGCIEMACCGRGICRREFSSRSKNDLIWVFTISLIWRGLREQRVFIEEWVGFFCACLVLGALSMEEWTLKLLDQICEVTLRTALFEFLQSLAHSPLRDPC